MWAGSIGRRWVLNLAAVFGGIHTERGVLRRSLIRLHHLPLRPNARRAAVPQRHLSWLKVQPGQDARRGGAAAGWIAQRAARRSIPCSQLLRLEAAVLSFKSVSLTLCLISPECCEQAKPALSVIASENFVGSDLRARTTTVAFCVAKHNNQTMKRTAYGAFVLLGLIWAATSYS